MRPSWMVVLLVLLAGCSTPRVVRLDTGQGKPLVHTPRDARGPVKLREDELRESMAEVARDVRPSSRPLRFARALMFESWQEEVYLEWTGRQLVLAAPEAPRLLPEQDELTRGYGRWCERKRQSKDCLSLLKDTPTLDADGRYTLAMAIAMDAVWNETKATWAEMANPEAARATVVSAMAMYMMLWLLPEPISKGLAATLTAGLIAWLGVDTVWGLIGGWRQLVAEVNRATTFAELREAGERYGRVMGRHAARAFLLLATAAIGNTAGLATKGPGLPGYSRAAVRTSWIEASADSDLGLWWIADDIRQLRPGASEDEIRLETLHALRPLLNRGLLRAVKLLPGGGYHPWEGSVDEQLTRIDAEWARLGRPPDIGEIVWFIGAR